MITWRSIPQIWQLCIQVMKRLHMHRNRCKKIVWDAAGSFHIFILHPSLDRFLFFIRHGLVSTGSPMLRKEGNKNIREVSAGSTYPMSQRVFNSANRTRQLFFSDSKKKNKKQHTDVEKKKKRNISAKNPHPLFYEPELEERASRYFRITS